MRLPFRHPGASDASSFAARSGPGKPIYGRTYAVFTVVKNSTA
jgi:hypothetical protein